MPEQMQRLKTSRKLDKNKGRLETEVETLKKNVQYNKNCNREPLQLFPAMSAQLWVFLSGKLLHT